MPYEKQPCNWGVAELLRHFGATDQRTPETDRQRQRILQLYLEHPILMLMS